MTGIVRTLDITVGTCSHGLPCCPHGVTGTRLSGSPDVKANGRDAHRIGDFGTHTCPHCGINMLIGGSPNVEANTIPVGRVGDAVTEFCGSGICVTGSENTKVNG